MNDISRLIVWGVCLFSGLWSLAFIDVTLARVFLPRDEKRLALQTSGKVEMVDSSFPLHEKLMELYGELRHPQVESRWEARRSKDKAPANLYLRARDPLFVELKCDRMAVDSVRYLGFSDTRSTRVLGINRASLSHIQDFAPDRLARPLRPWSVVLFGVGWAAFWLIPWKTRAANELRYTRGASVVGPLFVGTILGGVFYFLSLAVPLANGWIERGTNDETYGALTAVSLFFSLPAWIIWGIAAHSASFSLVLASSKLILRRWGKQRDIAADDLQGASIDERNCPSWLQRLFFVVSVLRPRSAGPLLLAASRSENVLTLRTKRGEDIPIALEYLVPLGQLFLWCESHGITVINNLSEGKAQKRFLEELEASGTDIAESDSNRRAVVIRHILGVIGLGVALWGLASLPSIPAIG